MVSYMKHIKEDKIMFKKIAIFLLVAVLAIGCLCSCGSEEDKGDAADTTVETEIKTEAQTEAITAPDPYIPVDGGKLGLSYEIVDGKLYVSGSIEENPGVAGFNLNLTFDQTKVCPIEFTDAQIVSVDEILSNLHQGPEVSAQAGIVTVFIIKAQDVTEDGKLFTVSFDILDGAAEAGYMEMSLVVDAEGCVNSALQKINILPAAVTVAFND